MVTAMSTVALPARHELRWALFGRHVHHDFLIQRLADAGCPPPLVVVSPDETYARDRRLLRPHGLYSELETFEERGLVSKLALANVNDEACLDALRERDCNIGFSIACRNIFKAPIIDLFDGRLFNLHDSYLPDERGGALNSWRILNGINSVGNTIHLIDEGIDTGAILFQDRAELEQPFPRPLDYDQAQLGCAHRILGSFLDAVLAGQPLDSQPQNNDDSLYFPRLYTELNGVIDFDWPTDHVERFIRAFSDPYPGAFTYVGQRKLHIHQARVMIGHTFHPFANGRVVTTLDDGSVNIVAGGGMINVAEVTVGDGTRGPACAALKIMDVLSAPADEIQRARVTVPPVSSMA